MVAKFLQESILIAFDFIWKLFLSNRNFATLLDPPLNTDFKMVLGLLHKTLFKRQFNVILRLYLALTIFHCFIILV